MGFGLVMIEGAGLADLARVGLHDAGTTAPGHEVLASDDPGALEVAGGLLIAQGRTDVSQENHGVALALGSRVVAAAVDPRDNTYLLSVYDDTGVRRHQVDTLGERGVGAGDPLPEEEGVERLDAESTVRIFERLTGVSVADLQDAQFTMLRPRQEHDEVSGRPWIKRLLGLHSDRQGLADNDGPPPQPPHLHA